MTTKNEIIEAEAKTSSLDLIKDENKLNTLKQGLDVDKNTLLLETNWEELNAQRKEQGLQKISNESMRKAYIDQQILMEKIEYNKKLNEHETLLRIYETMEA